MWEVAQLWLFRIAMSFFFFYFLLVLATAGRFAGSVFEHSLKDRYVKSLLVFWFSLFFVPVMLIEVFAPSSDSTSKLLAWIFLVGALYFTRYNFSEYRWNKSKLEDLNRS